MESHADKSIFSNSALRYCGCKVSQYHFFWAIPMLTFSIGPLADFLHSDQCEIYTT